MSERIDHPVVLNPEAIGNPNLTPIVTLPTEGDTTCSSCRRAKTPYDLPYHPMQALTGQPCGWYSGDDGEMCGRCMDEMMGRQRS